MKIIKLISVLGVSVVLIVSCLFYGYKLGIDDSAALVFFSEAGLDYIHLKMLNEKGEDKLREFLENDLDSTISIHKNFIEQQSFLSYFIGPEKIRNTQQKHYLNYYRGMLEYKRQNPSKDKQSEVLNDLEKLIIKVSEN